MGGGGDGGLVAVDGGQRADLPLALQVPEPSGLNPSADHVHENCPELVVGRLRHVGDPTGRSPRRSGVTGARSHRNEADSQGYRMVVSIW